eukprot:CAMPEP_0174837200 /NCGR_PEP_ID=MMETSP1114-20130205/6579_1 /TAXON_ID=312471 /ORGANISM="Neobodo designis, Strain CCAP 1951/1" /LENGTH=403 /DNA_ID=CAMNT_0016071249 /DNA_START=54 /DNA_END=1263 /DNA_ORIENTATION=-
MFETAFEILVALLGGGLLLYAAVTRFTTLAAVVQMGSIQERMMPWAAQSKKKKTTNPAELLSSALSTTVEKVADVTASASSKVASKVVRSDDEMEAVKLHDQIVYTASLVNVMITGYIMGLAPHNFYMWHTPKAIIYTAHRWYTFKKQNQHYLLYDFCYWANALAIAYCWFFPENEVMFQIVFMVANGPLAWAVLAFSQSLIFHSAPHMTSVFIHTSPMLLSYALRWYPSPFKVCANWPECSSDRDPNVEIGTMLWNAHAKFYLWWVVIYYLWVYVVMNRRIQERGYKTLYDRVSSRGPTKFLTKVSRNHLVQKAAYMVVHVGFATFTMLLATAYWRSQAAHLVFIAAILATSAWNASGFYFTVFANKYAEDLREAASNDTTLRKNGDDMKIVGPQKSTRVSV